MKTNDYLKYLTQEFVQYANQPKEDKLKSRLERKAGKAPFLFRWFGVLPYAFMMLLKRKSS